MRLLYISTTSNQRKMRRDMSEASHSEHVEIVRRGLGQHFNATDAMAHLAKSKVVVILLMQTFFRVTARTNLPSEPGLCFPQRPQRGLQAMACRRNEQRKADTRSNDEDAVFFLFEKSSCRQITSPKIRHTTSSSSV